MEFRFIINENKIKFHFYDIIVPQDVVVFKTFLNNRPREDELAKLIQNVKPIKKN